LSKKLKLDKINLTILSSLIEDGKLNYSKVGRKVNLSHVSIKNRFENLVKNQIIKPTFLLNFSKLDLKLGLILLEIDSQSLETLEKTYETCPRVINYFRIIGQYNFVVIFFAENLKTFETILNSCMIYNLKGIKKSNIFIFSETTNDLYFPINFKHFTQSSEKTPCGLCCKDCKAFINDSCYGCPGSKYYNGPLKIKK